MGAPQRKKIIGLFSYFGGKCLHAHRYPAPEHRTIIEPFAGSAGYSMGYYRRDIVLVEKNPQIAALWDWLIHVSPAEVRRLPILRKGDRISELPGLCDEARTFLGLRIGRGTQKPRDKASSWGTEGPGAWSERAREYVAQQVELIRHWKIIQGDYTQAPDVEATWFIDPPYQKEGFRYEYGSKDIDFPALASWCKARKGFSIVCENADADWLPFVPFFDYQGATSAAHAAVGKGHRSVEAIWVNRIIPCSTCAGTGVWGKSPCSACKGKGKI